MHKFRTGDLAWVHEQGGFLDLAGGTLVVVIRTYENDKWAVVRPLLYHGTYSDSGYFVSDYPVPQLSPIKLEAPDDAKVDVPQPKGQLPDAGRGAAGDAPPVREQAQPTG